MSTPVERTPNRFDAGGFIDRVETLRHRIGSASADPAGVRIVAVTKGFGIEAVRAATAAGLTDIGENYADELVSKAGIWPRPPTLRRSGTFWARCNATRWPAWPPW